MATRGSRRLAIENAICLGVAVLEGNNGESSLHIQTTDTISPVVSGAPANCVVTINAVTDVVIEVNTTSTVDFRIEIAGSLTTGDLVTIKFPPYWPTIRGKAGGYICGGVYVLVVP